MIRPRLSSHGLRRRTARAVTAVALGGWFALVPGAAARADSGDDGEVLAAPLPLGQAALIYVGIPLAIIALIWLGASIPSMVSAPRYRPGLSWWANPVWFGGPQEGGQESAAALTAPSDDEDSQRNGGTSARW